MKSSLKKFLRHHCTVNPINVFPEMKLRSFVHNPYIHVSVSYLYIPRIALPICLQQNRQTDPGIYKSLRYMNVENRRQIIIILFWK
jgi:hypothetical protein